MPQVVQLTASLSIWIDPRDHAPSPFHLIGPDTDAMVDLRSLQVTRGSYRRQNLRLAVAWATVHGDDRARFWKEQHDGA